MKLSFLSGANVLRDLGLPYLAVALAPQKPSSRTRNGNRTLRVNKGEYRWPYWRRLRRKWRHAKLKCFWSVLGKVMGRSCGTLDLESLAAFSQCFSVMKSPICFWTTRMDQLKGFWGSPCRYLVEVMNLWASSLNLCLPPNSVVLLWNVYLIFEQEWEWSRMWHMIYVKYVW